MTDPKRLPESVEWREREGLAETLGYVGELEMFGLTPRDNGKAVLWTYYGGLIDPIECESVDAAKDEAERQLQRLRDTIGLTALASQAGDIEKLQNELMLETDRADLNQRELSECRAQINKR